LSCSDNILNQLQIKELNFIGIYAQLVLTIGCFMDKFKKKYCLKAGNRGFVVK